MNRFQGLTQWRVSPAEPKSPKGGPTMKSRAELRKVTGRPITKARHNALKDKELEIRLSAVKDVLKDIFHNMEDID
jgi:hypothetical protein